MQKTRIRVIGRSLNNQFKVTIPATFESGMIDKKYLSKKHLEELNEQGYVYCNQFKNNIY